MGRPKIYKLREDYFSEIDSKEKSYILGFLAADGNVSKKYIQFTIQYKDIEILEFIKNEIGGNINHYPENNRCHLKLLSSKIAKDVEKYGILPKKSLTLRFPSNIDEAFIPDFVRGYFDGDGSVFTSKRNDGRKKKQITLSYVGTYSFCIDLENLLRNKCQLSYKKLNKHCISDIYYLTYSGSKQVEKIGNFMYLNSPFSLERKVSKFKNYYDGKLSF